MRSGKGNIQASKLNIVQKLLNVTDESLISKIEKMLEKEMVVGYTVDGKPLTKAAYDKRLAKAVSQIKAGKFTSQEDLEKEAESW